MPANVIGFVGIAVNSLIYQQKTRKRVLAFKLMSDVLWALHYSALGAYSAAAIAVIGLFRELIFFQDKKWSKGKPCLSFFIICSLLSAMLTWKSVFSILPAIASILSVLSFWKSEPKTTKCLAFPISICMLTYDIYSVSLMGIVNEIFTLISAFFGIMWYYKNKNSK